MDKSKVINLDGHSDIWTYTQDKKLLIEDEIGFDDNHIGLEGGKVVAEKLHRFINENS